MSGSGRPLYEPNPAATAAGVRYDVERLKRRPKTAGVPWIVVGSGAPAPDFQNSWVNVGGASVPMRYRFLPVHDPDLDPSSYTPSSIELQGAVTGGADGTTIFTLLQPDGSAVTFDYDKVLAVVDGAGAPWCVTVKTNGDIVDGLA